MDDPYRKREDEGLARIELTCQKSLEQDNFRIESNRQLLSIFNKITGAVQNTAAAFGVGVEAMISALDLAEKLDWVGKATKNVPGMLTAANELGDAIGAVELKSKLH